MKDPVDGGPQRYSLESAICGHTSIMGFVWGILRAVCVFFGVVIAALVVLDGSLLLNLVKRDE